MTATEKRIQETLEEHSRLASLFRVDANFFEQEKDKLIQESIIQHEDSSLRKKLSKMQELLDSILVES